MSRRVEQLVLLVGILGAMLLAGWSFARQQEATQRADRVADALEDVQLELTSVIGNSEVLVTEAVGTQAYWSTRAADAFTGATQSSANQGTSVAIQSTTAAGQSTAAAESVGGQATAVAAQATADAALVQLGEAQAVASTLEASLLSANAVATAVAQVGGQQAEEVAQAQQDLIAQQATIAAGQQVAPVEPTTEPEAANTQGGDAAAATEVSEPVDTGAGVTLGTASASLEVGADGCAGAAATQFTQTSTIYIVAAGSTVPADTEVAVRFYLNDQPYDELPIDTAAAVENGCISVTYGPAGSVAVLTRGDYRAEFRVGGEATELVVPFTID